MAKTPTNSTELRYETQTDSPPSVDVGAMNHSRYAGRNGPATESLICKDLTSTLMPDGRIRRVAVLVPVKESGLNEAALAARPRQDFTAFNAWKAAG